MLYGKGVPRSLDRRKAEHSKWTKVFGSDLEYF